MRHCGVGFGDRCACRASVVFDGVPSLLTALEALLVDPDVTVLRVKNRLDPEHQAHSTAGFRYVPETLTKGGLDYE
jgi:hypothetical protein